MTRDRVKEEKSSNKAARDKRESTILATELISVPPRTELLCHGKVNNEVEGKWLVCEPVDISKGEACVACAIVPNDRLVPLRIMNLSDREIRIPKGQKLGIAFSTEEEKAPSGTLTVGGIDLSDDKWMKEFDVAHLEPNIRKELHRVIKEFSELFMGEGDLLPSASQVRHSLTLESGAQSICKAPYRIPYRQREILQNEIDRLIKAKVIRPSASP